jgi:hypothetical protein
VLPRMRCDICDVLWTDLGNDRVCWVCGESGRRTGETVTAFGLHDHDSFRRVVVSRGLVWRIDQEEEHPW